MPPEAAVGCWTNRQVLQWLLHMDQKQFLAAFVENNVTGAVLLQALQSDTSGISLAQLAGNPPELQLAGLRGIAAQLLPVEPAEKNGWSFDVDFKEWDEFYLRMMNWLRYQRILKSFKEKKERIALLTLLLATATTVVSVVGSSFASNDLSSDAGGSSNSSTVAPDTPIATTTILSYVTTGLSALTTLLAGFSRIYDYDGKVEAWQTYIEERMRIDDYDGVIEQLQLPPHERDEISVWRERKLDRLKGDPQPPELDPEMWQHTLRQIARKQPEDWRSYYSAAYHLKWPGGPEYEQVGSVIKSEPSNVPRWAWWLGAVQFIQIDDNIGWKRAVDWYTSGQLSRFWPEEWAQATREATSAP